MNKIFHLTAEGVKELEKEVAILLSQRSEVAERIKTAREFGDLSENAEYSSARQDQEKAESRIAEIQHILKNVEVIAQPVLKDVVELGNTVILKGPKGDKKLTIVGSVEANPLEGKISNESPIGNALLGKKLGAEVAIETPSETIVYVVKTIE